MNRPYTYEAGYKPLAASIIEQAIHDLQISKEIVDRQEGINIKNEVVRFFKSDWFFTLADFLDLDPEKARNEIFKKYL